jgi:ribosome-associated protein
MDLEIGNGLTIPARELQWRFSRSSGPGGQHVNTSDSRVQLAWSPADSLVLSDEQRAQILARLGRRLVAGAIVVTVSEQRSQLRNRVAAIDGLRQLIADEGLSAPAPIGQNAALCDQAAAEAADRRLTTAQRDGLARRQASRGCARHLRQTGLIRQRSALGFATPPWEAAGCRTGP